MYGEPLGELFRRIGGTLGLTQARLASIVGLSAPMLSQLMSGRRAKIGNPTVVRRVQVLNELAEAVTAGQLDLGTLEHRLEEVRATSGGAFTGSAGTPGERNDGHLSTGSSTGSPTGSPALDSRAVVHSVQALLRALTSADRLLAAVRTLEPTHPELAEFLRVYGAGRTGEALEHYERIQPEL